MFVTGQLNGRIQSHNWLIIRKNNFIESCATQEKIEL